jgi:acetyl esterase/lipase
MWPAFTAELPDASFEPVHAGGVPAEWIRYPDADTSRVILYLHGGGYSLGSIATHRKLAGHIARAAGSTALVIDYRLAPEHPFPAGLDDAVTAYQWLLAEGFRASDVAIAGDSAGGGLTVATAIRLRDERVELPDALVTLSPWTDLAHTGESLETNREKDLLLTSGDNTGVEWYLGGGHADEKHPLVSPLYADLDGLPRLLVQVGSDEILLDDSRRLAERADAAGVDVTIEIWDEMQHVFQMGVGNMPESTEAVAKIGAWLLSNR